MEKKAVALYHRIMRRENFEVAAHDLFKLLTNAQKNSPNIPRILYLDIDGHRNEKGGFDRDMFELQQNFCLEFLLPFLSEVHCPLFDVKNAKEQNNDIPEKLIILMLRIKKTIAWMNSILKITAIQSLFQKHLLMSICCIFQIF